MKGYLTSNLCRWRWDGQPTVTRPAGAARPRQHARPAAAARQSRPVPALRSTKHNEVFTYGIGVTWGTRLAHHGLTAGSGGGWRRWPLFLEVGRRRGRPSVEFQLRGHHLRWCWVLGNLLIQSARCGRLSSSEATTTDQRQVRGGFQGSRGSLGLGFYRGWALREVQGLVNPNPTRFDLLNEKSKLNLKEG
jgi:hypothetical protein